jgi:hypothetical protein
VIRIEEVCSDTHAGITRAAIHTSRRTSEAHNAPS